MNVVSNFMKWVLHLAGPREKMEILSHNPFSQPFKGIVDKFSIQARLPCQAGVVEPTSFYNLPTFRFLAFVTLLRKLARKS